MPPPITVDQSLLTMKGVCMTPEKARVEMLRKSVLVELDKYATDLADLAEEAPTSSQDERIVKMALSFVAGLLAERRLEATIMSSEYEELEAVATIWPSETQVTVGKDRCTVTGNPEFGAITAMRYAAAHGLNTIRFRLENSDD